MTAAPVIDFTNWKITLPISVDGSKGPGEVAGSKLADALVKNTYAPYFTQGVDANGSYVAFLAPVTGLTTSNSGYPRSELREMLGADKAAWSGSDGKYHTMLQRIAWTSLPTGKPHVVGGQIHDADDDYSVFRLEGSSLWVTSGDTTHYKLVTDKYVLGTAVDLTFVVGGGKCLAYFNGTLVATLDASKLTGAYFKAGAYTQANKSNADPVTSYNTGSTRYYGLEITHGAKPGRVTFQAQVPPGGTVPSPVDSKVGVGSTPTASGPNAVLFTPAQPVELTLGPAASGKVYDGQGNTVRKITINADNVTVQNFRVKGAGNAGIYSIGKNNVIRSNDVSEVSDPDDINGISFFGDGTQILNNNIDNLVKGDPGGSHTDGIQTWNTPSKLPSSNVIIRGNRINGPPKSDPGYLHQGVMAEGRASTDGGGGGTGDSKNWLVDGNYFKTYGYQCLKFDDIDNVHVTRNTFAGEADKIVETGDLSVGIKFYEDNVVTGKYGSIGLDVTPGKGPDSLVSEPPPTQPIPQTIPKAKRTIIVLRHGEKDDNADGKDDILHELSAKGRQRAEAFKAQWLAGKQPAGLPKPDRCIASKGTTASNRPLKTIQPYQQAAGLPMNTRYDAEKDYKTLGPWLAQRLDVTMVCLEHSAIVKTCKLFGKISPGLPKAWDDKRFDMYWVFTSDDGKNWTFTQVPELLLPGDKATPIK